MHSAIRAFILVFFVVLGTGALGYLHVWQHAVADAQAHARMHADLSHDDSAPAEHSHHDESNCFIHALLSAQAIWQGWVPYLASLGLLVLFLSSIAPPLVSRRPLLRIDCRGPPTTFFAI